MTNDYSSPDKANFIIDIHGVTGNGGPAFNPNQSCLHQLFLNYSPTARLRRLEVSIAVYVKNRSHDTSYRARIIGLVL